jgi:hypothetical protein
MRGGCSRVVCALLATAAIGLGAWLLFGSAVLNYDAAWSLVWTRDLLVGAYDAEGAVVDPTRPLSGTFSRPLVPTPHPLTDAVSGLLAPVSLRAPAASEQALLVLALAALGALGVVTYHLGARLGGRLVGILAAAMLLTREPVLAYGLRAYLDIPYTVLLLGAGLSALSGRSAAIRTMVLLTSAGLLRPEAWALAGAYWIYLAWTGRLDRRLGLLAGVCVAAPLAWLATGWVIAGDPLLALTHTTATAEILQRRTGLLNGLVWTPRRLGEILRVEGLIGGIVGLTIAAMVWRSRRARTASPDAPSASDTARSEGLVGLSAGGASLAVALVVMGVAGLPINTRYLLPQGAIAVLAWAFAVAGWRSAAGGLRLRSWWKWAGFAVAAITIALIPWQVSRLQNMHARLASERDAAHDLRTLATETLDADATEADRGSGCSLVVGTPSERTVPTILLWSQLSSWVIDHAVRAYLVQRVAEPGDEHFVLVPVANDVANGWLSVATVGDWSVLAAPRCAPS